MLKYPLWSYKLDPAPDFKTLLRPKKSHERAHLFSRSVKSSNFSVSARLFFKIVATKLLEKIKPQFFGFFLLYFFKGPFGATWLLKIFSENRLLHCKRIQKVAYYLTILADFSHLYGCPTEEKNLHRGVRIFKTSVHNHMVRTESMELLSTKGRCKTVDISKIFPK